jgi:hypothetical protein
MTPSNRGLYGWNPCLLFQPVADYSCRNITRVAETDDAALDEMP